MTPRERFAAAARRQAVHQAARSGLKSAPAVRVYVAGPISGQPGGNRDAFERARTEIEAHPGVRAVVPFDLYEPSLESAKCPALVWTEAMLACLPAVESAHYIYLLDGWQHSRGAYREAMTAFARKIPFLFEEAV